MKKKVALAMIEKYLYCTGQAVLLKGDKAGTFHVAFTKECVVYQQKRNPERIVKIFYKPIK